jgi:hypothetical protein
MRVIAVNPNQTYEYRLGDDTPEGAEEGEPVFTLKPLTAAELAEIQDLRAGAGSRNLRALQLGLKGWRDLKDEEENDIPFPKKWKEGVDLLPTAVRNMLASRIILGPSSRPTSSTTGPEDE